MNEYKKELEYYSRLNSISRKGGVVLFGSTFGKNIPVSELAQTFEMDCKVYNRSFTDLSVFDAAEILDEAVMKNEPDKIIIQLGETDLERGYKSVDEIVSEYEKLINKIKKTDKKIKIVIVSVCSDETETAELNKALEVLADRCRCQYADISCSVNSETPFVKAFSSLRLFISDRLSLSDIMSFSGAY